MSADDPATPSEVAKAWKEALEDPRSEQYDPRFLARLREGGRARARGLSEWDKLVARQGAETVERAPTHALPPPVPVPER